MPIGRFLNGIAALIYNPAGKRYLFLRRAEHRDFLGGSWECVTGRVDQGESYTQALHREVREELNARVQIDFIVGLTHFFRGEEKPENEMLGVIFACTLLEPHSLSHSDEHSEQRWATYEEAQAFLPENHWLRSVLLRAEMIRTNLSPELTVFHQKHGHEI